MAYAETIALTYESRSGQGVSATFINYGDTQDITLLVKMGALTGSAYPVVYLEDSPDGTDWFAVDSIAPNQNSNTSLRTEKAVAENVRVRYDFRGPGSAPLGVTLISR